MIPKPKVLLVADTYYPKVDGILRFMEQFISRSRQEFDLRLLVPDFGVKKESNVSYVTPSRFLSLSGYPSLQLSMQNIRRIKAAIREADIVFIQGPALLSYFSMYYASKLRKKSFFYLHVLPWELFVKFTPGHRLLKKLLASFIRWASIFFYNHCDGILVPYQELKEELRHEGVTSTIAIARLGVDIERFTPAKNKEESKRKIGLSPHKKVIGYVGRISREKNVGMLLDAFQKLNRQEEGLFLLLVGDGPEEQKRRCMQIANCRVTGFVENVEDYLKAMDIFVLPSLTETTSLATLEAMATGLPVVVTPVGFVKKYLVKDYNGIFFPRKSSSLLAVKLEKLLLDKGLREKLGQNARKTVAYSFSWERSVNKIKKIMVEMVQQQ